jgi:hypothetical protein
MNTENWKWFRYDEIFEIKKGFFNKKPEEGGLGTIPFIGATDSNNGVTSWYTKDEIDSTPKAENTENVPLNEKIFDVPCITVSNNGSVGFAFYQTQPFTCSHDVNPLYLKDRRINLTPSLAFFLCGIIECEQFRWTYGRKWRPERMPSSLIKLPMKEDGQPDWQWMEEFVKNVLLPKMPEKARQVWEKRYDNKPLSAQKLELKTDEWQWFRVGDLFDLEPTKGTTTNEMVEGSDIMYIAAKKEMNGMNGYFALEGNENYISKGNCIVFIQIGAGSAGYTTYQPFDFIGMSGKTTCGYNKHLNQYVGLFLMSVLDKERPRYSFGRSWTGDRLANTRIKLPAILNAQGEYEPDWQWMEDYIKGLPYSGCL